MATIVNNTAAGSDLNANGKINTSEIESDDDGKCTDTMADNFGAQVRCRYSCSGRLTSAILADMNLDISGIGLDSYGIVGNKAYCFMDELAKLQV